MADAVKSASVVHAVHRPGTVPPEAATWTKETLTLGWEERLRARARRQSDAGTPFATALPRGTVLRGGDLLMVEAAHVQVEVVELAEAVLVVRPESAEEWALFGYFIGNSHQPMMVTPEGILVPDLLGMSQILEFHRVPFDRAERPFTPVSQVPGHRHSPGV